MRNRSACGGRGWAIVLASVGIVACGGVARIGEGSGGASTGGFSIGGASTGGVSSGGISTGGASSGGTSTGGASTGGASTGGVSTGVGGSESCDSPCAPLACAAGQEPQTVPGECCPSGCIPTCFALQLQYQSFLVSLLGPSNRECTTDSDCAARGYTNACDSSTCVIAARTGAMDGVIQALDAYAATLGCEAACGPPSPYTCSPIVGGAQCGSGICGATVDQEH